MNRYGWCVALAFALLLSFVGASMAAEGARPDINFNHDQTRFSLTGVHTNTACDSCHVRGVFKGTPTTCTGCHAQGGLAVSSSAAIKPVNHIPTTADCSTCHKTAGWTPTTFTHAGLTQSCASCHNRTIETGKPTSHILTNQDCGSCHKTIAWTPAAYDHAGVQPGTCSTCHNGSTASGKPARHLQTTQQCDVCHKTFSAWLPAGYTHAASDIDCKSCHNGLNASGKTTNHISTTQQCSICHTQQGWLPANFDHAANGITAASNCATGGCHDGISATGTTAKHLPSATYTSIGYAGCGSCHTFYGWKPSLFAHTGVVSGTCGNCHIGGYTGATVKPAVHLPTGSQACDDCHQSNTAWLPTAFSHTPAQLAGKTCTTCHNGQLATGRPATHSQLILASGQCDTCHVTTAWKPTAMNHSGQTACATCHSYSSNTWTPGYAGHIAVGSRQCSDCHTTSNWNGPTFNHAGVTAATNCAATCHDGTHATGRPASGTSAHATAPMTNGTCGSCHVIGITSGQTFMSPTPHMDHTGATACSSCHSYNATRWSTPGSPTYANHISTTTQCSSCHLTTTAWSGGQIDHSAMSATTDCYSGCHDGTHASSRPVSGVSAHTAAPMNANTCGSCHANKGVLWTPPAMNHNGATACSSCHSFATAKWSNPGSPTYGPHIATTAECSTCHLSTTSWPISAFNHTGINSGSDCYSGCHDGVHGVGRPASGVSAHSIPPMTSNTCGSCHRVATSQGQSFKTQLIGMNHSGATACANCHSFTMARWSGPSPTYPGHITITQQCSACHTTSNWLGATYNHSGISAASNCTTGCHDGVHATGLPVNGVSMHTAAPMAGNPNCGQCHTGIGVSWTSPLALPGSMNNHTGTAGTCKSCHDFNTAK